MNIALIGTGNVGGALAVNWAKAGHTILLGVTNTADFKGKELLNQPGISAHKIAEATAAAQVIVIATPPTAIFSILQEMGDIRGKVIIDATNSVGTRPEPHATVYHALAATTNAELVKCFNSTGFENMTNPDYNGTAIDMFMAGDSDFAKQTARQLATDAGFANCYDFGKADKVELLEKFALSWINLAIIQGMGRGIAFKLLHRE